MTIDSTTHVVPAHEIDLVLYVEVYHANNTIGAHETVDRVDDGIELGYHAERIAHGYKLCASSISILVKIAYCLTFRDHLLAFVRLWFVFVQAEGAGILADDLNVGPSETGETLACHLAETWGKVHDVCDCQ